MSRGWWRGVSLVGLGVVLVLGLRFVLSGDDETKTGQGVLGEESAPLAAPTEQEPIRTKDDLAAAGTGAASSLAADETGRVEVLAQTSRAVVRGVVSDLSGAPVEGAEISWTPSSLGLSRGSHCAGTWQEMLAQSRTAVSDSGGAFELALPDETETGVVWVTKPGFAATHQWLEPGDQLGLTFELEESVPLQVNVRRADGKDVTGAHVIFRGSVRNDLPLDQLEPLVRAQQLLLRVVEIEPSTEPQSKRTILLPEVGENLLLRAEAENVISSSTLARAPGPVDLLLQPTFVLVITALGDTADPVNRPQAEVMAIGGQPALRLIRLNADGTGEGSVPTVACEFYRVILSGGSAAVDSQDFPAPEAGARVELTFELRPGAQVPLLFTQPGGEPVSMARAGVNWDGADGRPRTDRPATRSNDQGIAILSSVPEGPFWVEYTHADYVNGFAGPYDVATLPRVATAEGEGEVFEPIVIVLTPEAEVTGRVVGGGANLLDYSLFAWPADSSPSQNITLDVDIDDEGVFRFRIPAGEISVAAWAEGFAQSDSVQVTADPAGTEELVIQLPNALLGRGRILDSTTRKPIAGVPVYVRLTEIGVPFSDIETPLLTNSDGYFKGVAFSPHGLASVMILLDGYASASASATPVKRELGASEIDFGEIYLVSESTLDLTVTGYEGGGNLTVSIPGTDAVETPLISTTEGLAVRIAGVKAGRAEIRLFENGRTMHTRQTELLNGSGPWQVRIDVDASTSLEVSLDGIEASGPGASLIAGSDSGGLGLFERAVAVLQPDWDSGSVTVFGLPPGPVTLRLRDGKGVVLGVGMGTITPGTVNHARLETDRPSLSVLLTDTNGQPLTGAYVMAAPPELPMSDRFNGKTNSDGLAMIGPVPYDKAYVRVIRADGAMMSGVPLAVPADGTPAPLVFDSKNQLSFQARDGKVPLAGLEVITAFHVGGNIAVQLPLDGEGKLTYGPMSDTDFDCYAVSSWVWPAMRVVHTVSEGAAPVEIQFRRRGGLVLRVQNEFGVPLLGIPVTLKSVEYGEDVLTWLDEGKVTGAPTGMTTDAAGEVHLQGLPNGEYIWQSPVLDLLGVAQVPPLDEGIALIQLP